MSNEARDNWRGRRMREAMEARGLTSGQIAQRMDVTDGAVRAWTTGHRQISVDDLERFAFIVRYPVEYFIREEYRLPKDFDLHERLKELTELIRPSEPPRFVVPIETLDEIMERVDEATQGRLTSDERDLIRRIIADELDSTG